MRRYSKPRRQNIAIGIGDATPDCSAPQAFQAMNYSKKPPKLETVFTQPALCASFYENKTTPDPVCEQCILQSRKLDSDCPCEFQNFCQFAQCVSSQSKKCKQTHEMLYNTKFKPFEFKDLKNCEVFETEGFTDYGGYSWKPWQIVLLVVFGLGLAWAIQRWLLVSNNFGNFYN